jgi:hypothetical protein
LLAGRELRPQGDCNGVIERYPDGVWKPAPSGISMRSIEAAAEQTAPKTGFKYRDFPLSQALDMGA